MRLIVVTCGHRAQWDNSLGRGGNLGTKTAREVSKPVLESLGHVQLIFVNKWPLTTSEVRSDLTRST